MKKTEFKELLDKMEAEEHETILGKGEEYTRSQADRLSSFKEIASFAGVTPKQVCMIFVAKHWQALANFVATGKTKSSEPIEGRIMDIRVYMSLMRAIIQEERQNPPAPEVKLRISESEEGYWLHLELPDGKSGAIALQASNGPIVQGLLVAAAKTVKTITGGCKHIWVDNPAQKGKQWCATCGAFQQ